jgi:hypothetical protein
MSSQSRNSGNATRAVKLAFAATLLAGSAAYAADQPHTFELTAFSNGAGGASIVSGDYNTAIVELGAGARNLDGQTLSTNRCVAYAVTHQLQAAHAACDSAVREAQAQIAGLPISMSWARSEYRNYLALAYSNRAVVDWMSNDTSAAQVDLKKAAAVAPKAEFVARNQTALQSHAAVAQVAVVPKS